MSYLVIVESPTKVKTISKYLGTDYEVIASMGHIRDLPKSKLGIDIENNFQPQYINIKGKYAIIKELKKRAKECSRVYLATDPDREGEAISWHIAQMLKLDMNENNRVKFNEITKIGVSTGISNPHKIDIDLVKAQQTRRILDRLMGYKLSPFLWKKVKKGLSAGRVQSVALRLIVDRETEIQSFIPKEYWSIDAQLSAPESRTAFNSNLVMVDGKKIKISTKAETNNLLSRLEDATYTVKSVKKRIINKPPGPAFTTSTMQQEASYKLGFRPNHTMKIAQELYEGVEVNGLGAIGLITYMRTDSVRISNEAKVAAAYYIQTVYGKDYLHSDKKFKINNNAQNAHEAIRPSNPELTPEIVKSSLTLDQFKLYKLIWVRFIASQMANAVLDTVSVKIEANGCLFHSSGHSVKFKGFTVIYDKFISSDIENEHSKILPKLNVCDKVHLKSIVGNQHFTTPPMRFTEASLIKVLEAHGIGRPSTYAPTVTTITERHYVDVHHGKVLKPTNLGKTVTELMKNYFNEIVDIKFTAKMEENLDSIENGTKDWILILYNFYHTFESILHKAEADLNGKRFKIIDEETDFSCEFCGKKMVIKFGRYGKFLACSSFPKCSNTKNIINVADGNCPKCSKKLLIKRVKNGKKFYGCAGYPECNFMTWNVPTSEICPNCKKSLFSKSRKLICENKECEYEKELKL